MLYAATLLVFVFAGAIAIAVMVRRAPREIDPAIRAFAELRSALQPAVVELSAETGRTRERVEALRDPGTEAARR